MCFQMTERTDPSDCRELHPSTVAAAWAIAKVS